jgi:hypothetical protein
MTAGEIASAALGLALLQAKDDNVDPYEALALLSLECLAMLCGRDPSNFGVLLNGLGIYPRMRRRIRPLRRRRSRGRDFGLKPGGSVSIAAGACETRAARRGGAAAASRCPPSPVAPRAFGAGADGYTKFAVRQLGGQIVTIWI